MTRRDVVATTHLDRHFTKITKEALEGAAKQVNCGHRPYLTVDHDLTIPPYGKAVKAWVEPREDGEYQLVIEHDVFEKVSWLELSDGNVLFKQGSKTDNLPFADRYAEINDDLFLSYDWVNFKHGEASKLFIEEIKEQSKAEFSVNEFGRKSLTPDPEIIIGVAKIIGSYLIAKNVLNKIGEKVTELAAKDLEQFYTFIKSVVLSAVKYARPQNRPITYVFVARGKLTIEFIACSSDPHHVISSVKLEKLESAMSQASAYQSLFKAVKIQYLLNSGGDWGFNYLLTETGDVIGTEKSLSRRARRFEILLQQQEALEQQQSNLLSSDQDPDQ